MALHQQTWNWEELLNHERALIASQAADQGVPLTGPPELNTGKEILNLLARLAVMLDFQICRAQLMELDRDYSRIYRWLTEAEGEVQSMGEGSIEILRLLQRHGY